MDCSEIRDLFLTGQAQPSPEVERHLRDCPACRELFGRDARIGQVLASGTEPVEPDLGPLLEDVEQTLARESGARAWLRSRPTAQRLAMVGVAAALIVVLGAARHRADLESYPKSQLVAFALLLSFGVFACVRAALAPLTRPRTREGVLGALVLVGLLVPFVVALGGSAHAAVSAPAAMQAPDFWRHTLACFRYGFELALPLLALLWAISREDRLPPSKLLLGTAAAGLVANLCLLFHCARSDSAHVAFGHASVGVALSAVALLAFAALARPRRL